MAREVLTARQVADAYLVKGVYDSLVTSIGGHTVQLQDDLPTIKDPDALANTRVRILVDGRDYSVPVTVKARPAYEDANRYHGFVSLKRLTDRRSGKASVVVAQALGGSPGSVKYSESEQQYRLLVVSEDGIVKEDVFSYSQRGSPPLRAYLMSNVVPHPFGFHSDLMQVWPSFWYPVFYPWLSGLVGALLVIGSWMSLLRRPGV